MSDTRGIDKAWIAFLALCAICALGAKFGLWPI